MNQWLRNILILLAVAGLGFAFGRYATPEKIVTKTEIKEVQVIKEVEKKDTKKNKEVVIVKVQLPDGTIRTETHIIDKGEVVVDSSKDVVTTHDEKHETITSNEKPQWSVYGVYPISARDLYTIGVDKRILGPVFFGISGTSNKDFSDKYLGFGARVEF